MMRLPRDRPGAVAFALCGLLCLAYVLTVPATADLAAQRFRADLWTDNGFVIWSDAWYSGHTVPGYSLTYPPLGALLGPVALGIASALTSTAIFIALAGRAYGDRAWLGIIWFGLASTVALWGSRTTFALGMTIGMGALLALQRGRPTLASTLGLLVGITSPVAGLFTALAAGAVFCAGRIGLGRARPPKAGLPANAALALAIAASAATLLMGLAFPTDGYEPFRLAMWLWIPGIALVAIFAVSREEPVIRWAGLLYLLLALPLIAVETPLGDNAVRLGYTFAGPVFALSFVGRRTMLLALVALPLLYWQWTATANDIYFGLTSDSAERSYFEPMLDRVEAEELGSDATPRIHVPPTRTRWEARYVPERFTLARGWLRQLESDDFELFRSGNLDPPSYELWLEEHGVSYVARAKGVELDYMGRDEAELLSATDAAVRLPFLRPVWSNDDWDLWEVVGGQGEVPGLSRAGARVLDSGPDGYQAEVPGPGTYTLPFRYSPYLEVTSGEGCITASDGAEATTTELTVDASGGEAAGEAGVIGVEAKLSFAGLLRRSESCSNAGP